MIEADCVHSTPPLNSSSIQSPDLPSEKLFNSLADAEAFFKSRGFWLVADSCDWTNIEGDDAGVYAIDGCYGTVKSWRVEINRRVAPSQPPTESASDSPKPVQGLSHSFAATAPPSAPAPMHWIERPAI